MVISLRMRLKGPRIPPLYCSTGRGRHEMVSAGHYWLETSKQAESYRCAISRAIYLSHTKGGEDNRIQCYSNHGRHSSSRLEGSVALAYPPQAGSKRPPLTSSSTSDPTIRHSPTQNPTPPLRFSCRSRCAPTMVINYSKWVSSIPIPASVSSSALPSI